MVGASAELRILDGTYRIVCIDPSDRTEIQTWHHTSMGIRQASTVELPSFADDLVILIERTLRHTQTPIPGTQ